MKHDLKRECAGSNESSTITPTCSMTDKPKIYAAMNAVMREMTSIGKGNVNQQQGFRYRSIDDCYNALNPLLAKHGIFTTPEVLDKTREERTNAKGTVLAFTCLRMKYTFWADDGSSVSCVVEGEGMDSGDKSSNKAMAVAHKYALLQTFCVPTEEQKDTEAEDHNVAPFVDSAASDKLLESIDAAQTLDQLREVKAAVGMANLAAPARKAVVAAWNARKAALEAA